MPGPFPDPPLNQGKGPGNEVAPLPENRKDENRKMWKLKDGKIVAAEISLINSVPVRIT